MNKSKFLGFTTIGLYLTSALGFTSIATAGSLTPNKFEANILVERTVSLERTVTLDTSAVSKLDVLFLADNTGSMGPAIDNVKTYAQSMLQQLSSQYKDIEFGVARYNGDPSEGVTAKNSYQLLEPVNGGGQNNALAAIKSWYAIDGGDTAEANLFALHQAATSGAATKSGYSTGYDTKWRSDAKKIIVWFGDAYSHTGTIGLQETVDALKANEITVIAINITSANSIIDGINKNSQASTLASNTGGNYSSSYSSSLASDILSSITASTKTLDLVFSSEGNTDGLDITYTCTDSRGCNDVPSGQSRKFTMNIVGLNTGIYEFDTVVIGINNAVADNTITVNQFVPD